ncbi:MAG: 5'-nucleotidase C-terminal domain-containing protein [Erysipelotrichaceae bacterium]
MYAKDFGSKDEFAMMPFYSGDNPGDDYVLANPISFVAVNEKVDDKGNEEKFKLVTKFLDYIATKEGQTVFVPDGNTAVTQLKDAELSKLDNVMLKNVSNAMDSGRMIPLRPLFNAGVVMSRDAFDNVINSLLDTGRRNKSLIKEDRPMTYEEAVAYLDKVNDDIINQSVPKIEKVYATAEKPFTVLETSQYFAQMLKNKTGADIGLYLSNTLSYGNNMGIQKGVLIKTDSKVNAYDFVSSMDTTNRINETGQNSKKFIVTKIKGSNLIKVLENPTNAQAGHLYEPFFVAAGLKIEFAPWAEKGSRYLKVTLPDGREIDPNKEYTVASWNYIIQEELIVEKVKVIPDSFQDILKEQLEKDKIISPFDDGRFVLNWKVVSKKDN